MWVYTVYIGRNNKNELVRQTCLGLSYKDYSQNNLPSSNEMTSREKMYALLESKTYMGSTHLLSPTLIQVITFSVCPVQTTRLYTKYTTPGKIQGHLLKWTLDHRCSERLLSLGVCNFQFYVDIGFPTSIPITVRRRSLHCRKGLASMHSSGR